MNKILWFRFDLRLHDNEAVKEALKDGKTLPIFIFDENYFKLETSSTFHLQFCIDSISELEKMFQEAEALNQDLSTWNVFKATNMECMFYDAKLFNRNLSS